MNNFFSQNGTLLCRQNRIFVDMSYFLKIAVLSPILSTKGLSTTAQLLSECLFSNVKGAWISQQLLLVLQISHVYKCKLMYVCMYTCRKRRDYAQKQWMNKNTTQNTSASINVLTSPLQHVGSCILTLESMKRSQRSVRQRLHEYKFTSLILLALLFFGANS